MHLRNFSKAWKIGREKMKASNKSSLKKLEERNRNVDDPKDCVIIFDPELPLPDLAQSAIALSFFCQTTKDRLLNSKFPFT